MTARLDNNRKKPRYLQLKEILKEKIRLRNYDPGERFLSSREIMKKFKVSPYTVAQAMDELNREGILERRIGGGTFIKSLASLNNAASDFYRNTLFISGFPVDKLRLQSPLNWFIRDEIQQGVINTYRGSVCLTPQEKLIDELRSFSKEKSVVLINYIPDIINFLEDHEIPYVIVNLQGKCPRERQNTISCNMMNGVYELISYLYNDLGHEKIAMITHENHADRIAAYQIGLRSWSLPYNEDLVVYGYDGSKNDGRKAMKKLLALPRKRRPTAIFADTDLRALGALEVLQEHNIKVPEQMSLAGYDDIQEVRECLPPLTTVRVPNYERGVAAAEMLMKMLDGCRNIKPEMLQTKLIVRKSCSTLK